MNYTNVAILLTFFSLWLTNYASIFEQEYLAYGLIFTVGILHGSNDLAIVNKLKSISLFSKFLIVLGIYLLIVFLAGLMFYFLPIFAIISFVLFSAYHFGEQHWEDILKEGRMRAYNFLFLVYGSLILFLLFYLNQNETIAIVQSLTSYTVPTNLFLYGFTIGIILFIGLLLYMIYRNLINVSRCIFELFLLVVLAIVFKYANLIWAFAIYFIYWHSVPSIIGQLDYLYGAVTYKALKKYLMSSALIWLVSVGSMLAVFYIFRTKTDFIMPLFFAFLGAITFAHSIIITRMIQNKKAKQ